MSAAVSILDVALARGATPAADGSIDAGQFERLRLPFFAGCEVCQATLGPYNAYPSRTGFIRCRDCIADLGFATPELFVAFCEAPEAESDLDDDLDLQGLDADEARSARAWFRRLDFEGRLYWQHAADVVLNDPTPAGAWRLFVKQRGRRIPVREESV